MASNKGGYFLSYKQLFVASLTLRSGLGLRCGQKRSTALFMCHYVLHTVESTVLLYNCL